MTFAVKLTKGSYTVEIAANKVEEDIQNQNVIKIARPISKANQDTQVPRTLAVDLKRIIHSIYISGFIEAQTISGDDKTATEAKNILIKEILYPSGAIQLNWRGSKDSDYDPSGSSQYLSVVLEKVKFTDAAVRTETPIGSADLVGQYGTPQC